MISPAPEDTPAPEEELMTSLGQSYWVEVPGQGFLPKYRFLALEVDGALRPFRRFLKGERESVARYFLCLVCETIYGEAPLTVTEEGDRTIFQDNPSWHSLPYMERDSEGTYAMSDGSSLFDVCFAPAETG